MPRDTNKAARIIVPLLGIALGAIVVFGVLVGGNNKQKNQQAEQDSAAPIESIQASEQPADTSPPPALDEEPAPTPALTPAPTITSADQDPEQETTTTSSVDLEGLRPRTVDPALNQPFTTIGGGGPDTEYNLLVEFTQLGAGVEGITLTHEYTSVEERFKAEVEGAAADRYILQKSHASERTQYAVASLAAHTVEINGVYVGVFSSENGPIWRQTNAGATSAAFEAIIETKDGAPVARITKAYSIRPGSYDIHVDQRIENLTDTPLDIRLYQYGPVDLSGEGEGYGGDKRRVRFGKLRPVSEDPQQRYVESSKKPLTRRALVKKISSEGAQQVWPNKESISNNQTLVWTALTNRYFAFAVHAPITDAQVQSGAQLNRAFTDVEQVWATIPWSDSVNEVLVLQLNSPVITIEPGAANAGDFSLGAYAGPIWERPLRADPTTSAVGLDTLVIYNFGGPCAFCTFQPLAKLLLWFLETLHDYVVLDWAVAIMILVFCVRLMLHPVTKKSQIALQRFSKQMQALAPKQKKLQEKYKDDPKRLQQEMGALMREEGVNFAGALGCLPMFLQTPVWIALYAMLFFAYDLRHEPAFYGVFQKLTGGDWKFMGDLSAPDGFISFAKPLFSIPLMGEISSINVLPLLLGIVFFIQQKYLTPAPSATMTPEQQSQQKIIRVMMVVMFPVIMYNAPSGLALYFCTNSTLGILESRHIRAHIDQMDLEKKPESGQRKKVTNRAARREPKTPNFKQRKK